MDETSAAERFRQWLTEQFEATGVDTDHRFVQAAIAAWTGLAADGLNRGDFHWLGGLFGIRAEEVARAYYAAA